jgi:hypothetical protein
MKTCFFLLVAAFLGGCASGPVAAAKKAGITKVHVERRVEAEQGMRYGIDMSAGGNLANSLASMIINNAGQKGIARMSDVMASNQIVVPEIIHQRASQKFGECNHFTLAESGTDAVFLFTILQYGFEKPDFESKKCPVIILRAELRDRKGAKVWAAQNSLFQLTSKGIGASWEEYEADPARLRTDWEKQIQNILDRLLKCE